MEIDYKKLADKVLISLVNLIESNCKELTEQLKIINNNNKKKEIKKLYEEYDIIINKVSDHLKKWNNDEYIEDDTDEENELSIEEMLEFLSSKTSHESDLKIERFKTPMLYNKYWEVNWRPIRSNYETVNYYYRGICLKKVIYKIYKIAKNME
ncbi:MAG: hypothetical protein ACLPWD_00755 [Methanobacterium sp.]